MKTSWIAILFLSPVIAHALVGGHAPLPLDPMASSTVAIQYGNPSDPNYCSASLIANDLLVTAAHCVKWLDNRKVIFSSDATLPSSFSLPVVSCATPQNFDPNSQEDDQHLNAHDIALVYFQGTLPAGYKPATLLDASVQLQTSDHVVFGGYGLTDDLAHMNDSWPWGKLDFSAPTTILNPILSTTEIKIQTSLTTHARNGDSGGPAFLMNGTTPLLFGVDIWGESDRSSEVFTDIRAYLSWIQVTSTALRNRTLQGCGSDPFSSGTGASGTPVTPGTSN